MYRWFNSRILLLVLVLVLLFSGFLIISSNSKDSKDSKDSLAPLLTSQEKIVPVRIKIASIGVEASIKPAGLTKEKKMESPEEPGDTVWFELGVSPGEKGSSVIAGHRGWQTGPAIFDDLDKVKPGDEVHVEDEKGNTRVFVVRELRIYDADEIVLEVWNKEDSAYLNLITCSGGWNSLTGTSNERLVVFTDLVS